MNKKNFNQIKLSILIAITSISIISIHKPAVAESIQIYDSNFLQIQTQCRKKDNDGSKRGRPKRRKPMGTRLYSDNY
ncbi:hypothetical protein NIES267_54490 [Calothrix parasitica NIES-267]|uniref:Uncharacterized protein n=1 Tax=Calothrix parasitica NIES-267 TaxID=1973488 RepID=A0A1Z4LXI8_9CYAN|nr:hypothetical protein NIES267_54490 [Calothrix parasitica NIES-267]